MHLYAIHLPEPPLDQSVQDALEARLKPPARERLKRFRLPEDALRSLMGQLAPVWYLQRNRLVKEGTDIVFDKKGKGKPVLAKPILEPALAFNTSHEGSLVLLGIARGKNADIGVDLMQVPNNPLEVQEGISDQLTLREKQALSGVISEADRARLLTLLWTLKEGYVKATGDGIVFGMERIEVELDVEACAALTVSVDQVDVKQKGWYWSNGWINDYGWTAYWKGEAKPGEQHTVKLEYIAWHDFIDPFID